MNNNMTIRLSRLYNVVEHKSQNKKVKLSNKSFTQFIIKITETERML